MKKLISFISAAFVCICSAAQTNDLTAEVQEVLKQQAAAKVNELTDHISFVMRKSEYDETVKDYHIKAAKQLFVGGGKAYEDRYGNLQPAPRMQVSSINRSTGSVSVKEYQVANYMNNLKYLSYDTIEVTNSKSTFISNLHKLDTDEYEAVLSWVQIFIGKRNDMVVYKDRTKKNIVVRMQRKNYGGVERWEVLLGDTTVSVTE